MNDVALVLSGNEVAQLGYADSRGFFRRACKGGDGLLPLTRELRPLGIKDYFDEDVPGLIDGLASGATHCVILSTSCLYSKPILRCLEAHIDVLRAYLDDGGGLIVLPQPVEANGLLTDLLGASFQPIVASEDHQALAARRPEDILLRFPDRIDLRRVARPADPTEPERVFWSHVELVPDGLSAVVDDAKDDAVAVARTRSGDGRRAVVSSVPFDWRRDLRMARNSLYFATSGHPFALMLTDPANAREYGRARFITELGSAVVREGPLDRETEWLLGQVRLLVVSDRWREESTENAAVSEFLRGGGTVLSVNDGIGSRDFVETNVREGNRGGRINVELVLGALAADTGWGETSLNDAISTRAILAFLRRANEALGTTADAYLPVQKRAALIRYLEARVRAGVEEDNVVALTARLESLTLLKGRGCVPRRQIPDRLRERAAALGPERAAQFEVALAAATGGDPAGELRRRASQLEPKALNLARLGAWMAAVAAADRLEALDLDRESIQRLVSVASETLSGHRGRPPWLTSEVTAEMLCGFSALVRVGSGTGAEELERTLGLGHVFLRARLADPGRDNSTSVVWRAKLTEALLASEEVSPLGLQMIDERRGTRPRGESEAEAAVQVVASLRDENVRIAEELRSARAQARGPARLGLATATLILAAALLFPWFGLAGLVWGRSLELAAQIAAVFLIVYPFFAYFLCSAFIRGRLLPLSIANALATVLRRDL